MEVNCCGLKSTAGVFDTRLALVSQSCDEPLDGEWSEIKQTWTPADPEETVGRTCEITVHVEEENTCLLYTSPSPRD